MAAASRFSLPPLLPSARLKRNLLPPELLLISASSKSLFPRELVASPGHRLRIRSMATEGKPQAIQVPKSVPVRVAHELLQAGHRYLDVRTPEEFSAGHAVGAVNVPYMLKVGSGMTKNPKFLEEILSIYGKDDEMIVGCQSGKRSLMAATDLTSAGFTGITDIAGGYSAWIQNGLPSE
uniref:Thiosulfate sulfurtransferase 16, chloroplastic n=1 Tax=Anthurium amnicola TaxID=1678845 RepID=A0A1D1ZEL5_9ARAE